MGVPPPPLPPPGWIIPINCQIVQLTSFFRSTPLFVQVVPGMDLLSPLVGPRLRRPLLVPEKPRCSWMRRNVISIKQTTTVLTLVIVIEFNCTRWQPGLLSVQAVEWNLINPSYTTGISSNVSVLKCWEQACSFHFQKSNFPLSRWHETLV